MIVNHEEKTLLGSSTLKQANLVDVLVISVLHFRTLLNPLLDIFFSIWIFN
jgi:hypothetical protein